MATRMQQRRGTAAQWTEANPILAVAEIGFERLSTCETCEHFEQKTSRCAKCGCYMKTKTQLAASACPIGKWNAVV